MTSHGADSATRSADGGVGVGAGTETEAGTDAGGEDGDGSDLRSVAIRLSTALPVRPVTLAGLLAFVPVAAATGYRVVNNAPGPLPPGVSGVAAALLPTAVVGPVLAALLLAATADAPAERVGLAFAGGFAPLALASPAAWVPAAVGVAGGGALVAAARLRRLPRLGWDAAAATLRRAAVAGVLVAAVVVSLAATAGVGGALGPIGSGLALVGVGLTPTAVGAGRPALLAGALAAVLTFGLAASVPYVAGAVLLVGGGVVGVPLGLVALAVGGGVAALAGALRRGRRDAALGAALLLVAGVPGTLLRALAVVVAVGLLLRDPGRSPGGEPA